MASAYEEELAQWNKPYVYRPYPKALYRAARNDNANIVIESCLVGNDDERDKAERQGWVVGGPDAAKARLNQLDEDVARAAAEAKGAAVKMSPKARKEHDARERATDDHVTE